MIGNRLGLQISKLDDEHGNANGVFLPADQNNNSNLAAPIFDRRRMAGMLPAESSRVHFGPDQSALEHFIAHGLPAVDEILFLRAARSLSRVAVMGMEMGGTVRNRILRSHVTFQPLMQIPGLRNIHGNPRAVRQLFGIDVKARQRSEGRVQGKYVVVILLAGLSAPSPRGGR